MMGVSRLARFVRCLAVLALTHVCGSASAQTPPAIGAASDLSFALQEIADRFARETGQKVDLVFSSSGTLTRQIRDGAPFEMFLSADEAFVDELAKAGRRIQLVAKRRQ